MAMYENIYVLRDASLRTRSTLTAQPPSKLYYARPTDARFVARYFPSKKAWRVYDLHKFWPTSHGLYIRTPKPMVVTPDRDAAIMAAILSLSSRQTELEL